MGEIPQQRPWENRYTVAATELGEEPVTGSTTANLPAQTTSASRHSCRPLDPRLRGSAGMWAQAEVTARLMRASTSARRFCAR
jgi:hypothetical protein